ncbi:FUSC family protein [Tamlana sp. 2_MG-2023]|uniref:FUSC family protein n=1 Tax=unclassified Tamlana TaxID=2614803 RepID=UPI0026E34E08|nr:MULTISPECIES: FUSC family protein [unclassified Tamlana]MDO6760030.1 FUSC family protein [Tamlana sp. 2_MG-2023]MDO6790272.1 FUSC family protein [Tamlana sp. 1_MG-2023]
MTKRKLEQLSDEELLNKKKSLKRSKLIKAALIGFCIGIIVYSVAENTWGLVTLIPVFFVYKLVNNSKKDKELETILKKRNLD